MHSTTDPAAWYTDADAAAALDERRHERRVSVVSHLRLVAVIGAVVALILAERGAGNARLAWAAAAAGAVLAFAALVVHHARTRATLDRATARRTACRLGLARMRREWSALPEPSTPDLSREQRTLGNDLGVTGGASLMMLLNVTTPSLGGARLHQWLLSDSPDTAVIRARAESVAALRRLPELLLGFVETPVHRRPRLTVGMTAFRAWASGTPGDQAVARARGFAWFSGLTVLAVIALLATDAPYQLVVLALGAQLTVTGLARWRLERDLRGVDDAFTTSAAIARSLEATGALRDIPGGVGALARRLLGERALEATRSLRRHLDWNNTRYSPLGLWTLNAAVGLDCHLWHGIVRWRRRHGARVSQWIDAAAEIEAHVALATLGFENPDWAMPEVHDDAGATAFETTQLGHPLLPPAACVRNDLRLGGAGDMLIVSGSNMSGKTTYLRSAGLASLLAQAGGPVCAASLSLRRCRVRTSVRVQDDLTSGVSLFFAEATRLRDIVHDARAAGAPVLFLLDEILHGTNATDRRTATRLVLAHLAQAGAFGIVTTHDPAIAPADAPATRQVHFGEGLAGAGDEVTLSFDYIVRDGPATSANALAILRSLGL